MHGHAAATPGHGAAVRSLPGAGPRPADVVVVGTGGERIVELLGQLPWLRQVRLVPSAQLFPHAAPAMVILRTDAPARDLRALSRVPNPPRAVLVISGVQTPHEVVEALRAGATSYLVDGLFTRADLVAAVLGTLNGHSHLSQPVVTAVVRQTRERAAAPAENVEVGGLSLRQREIMSLLAAGHSNSEIATRLFLSEKTVRNHVSGIYTKLRVRTRAEAIVYWLGQGSHAAEAC